MKKCKVGDKVRFVVDGKPQTGTITRAYGGGHDMYDVKVGTETLTLADTPMTLVKAANGCASTNSVIANAMAAKNAPGMKSGIVKEFTEYSKAALGDIRRQCNESLAVIKAQGKRLQEYAEKSGLSVEWSAIVDKGVIYVGVIQGILRDLDHAVSRY